MKSTEMDFVRRGCRVQRTDRITEEERMGIETNIIGGKALISYGDLRRDNPDR